MRSVCIGIHLQSEPERLRLTLASLKRNTDEPIDLLLLPDGSDASTRNFLATLDLVQVSAKQRRINTNHKAIVSLRDYLSQMGSVGRASPTASG